MEERPVIVITGASSGIGEATARLFGEKGYRVALGARRIDRLQRLAEEINAKHGEAFPFQVDLSRLNQLQAFTQAVLDRFGQIDILFNNAGFGRLNWLETLDPEEDIEAMLRVNLVGLIEMTQAVLPHMIQRRKGHIINMASVAGYIATPTYTVYAASKFAIRGFSESLRREVDIFGIRVSLICPGAVKTEFDQHTGAVRKTGIRTPQKLRLTSEEVAWAVYDLVRHPRPVYILPAIMRLAIWANILFPGVVDWVIERRFTRREREA